MALFGSARDASLIRSLNRELLQRWIDTEVLVYKINLNSTATNLYDETDSKAYDAPVLIHSLVTLDDLTWQNEEYGFDSAQTAQFAFLLDDLVDKDVRPEVGDVIEYKSRFFEIDGENENQYLAGKNPDNWQGGDSHGYSVSIIYTAHMTRQSQLNIVQTRFGNSVSIKDVTLPKNL